MDVVRMKRLFLCALVFAACVLYADVDDNLILWMFEDSPIQEVDGSGPVHVGDLVGRGGAAEGVRVNAIRLKKTDSDGSTEYLKLQLEEDVGGDWRTWITLPGIEDGTHVWEAGPAFADISGYSISREDPRTSFMIELGNYSGDGDWIVLAASESATLGSLEKGGHILSGPNDMQGHVDWTGGSYAVPEPSTGLLLLIGGGFLALRRGYRVRGGQS